MCIDYQKPCFVKRKNNYTNTFNLSSTLNPAKFIITLYTQLKIYCFFNSIPLNY